MRAYVKNYDKRYKVFVCNSVAEIRRKSFASQWFHIDGKSNPADILSRGCSLNKLPDCWLSGPEFWRKHKCDWPEPGPPPDSLDETEVISASSNVSGLHETTHALDKLIDYYSSFCSLKKAVSWLMRFIAYVKLKNVSTGPFTVPELADAECLILRHAQRSSYADEIDNLNQG